MVERPKKMQAAKRRISNELPDNQEERRDRAENSRGIMHLKGVVHSKQRRKSPRTRSDTRLAADTVHATVLFADMRGYTGLAERLAPAKVVGLLDEFFGVLTSATAAYGGQVYHLAGDGMMAGFGLGEPGENGARAAFAAGHAMLQQFAPIAARWQRELNLVTGMGVGLHFGEVALGLFGPPGNRAITLVGDTANVAARLCSRARTGEVLFSCTVATALQANGAAPAPTPGLPPFLQLPQFELRGRSGLLDIWCVPAAGRAPV
jgi:class 3 adenylate cyclase